MGLGGGGDSIMKKTQIENLLTLSLSVVRSFH